MKFVTTSLTPMQIGQHRKDNLKSHKALLKQQLKEYYSIFCNGLNGVTPPPPRLGSLQGYISYQVIKR